MAYAGSNQLKRKVSLCVRRGQTMDYCLGPQLGYDGGGDAGRARKSPALAACMLKRMAADEVASRALALSHANRRLECGCGYSPAACACDVAPTDAERHVGVISRASCLVPCPLFLVPCSLFLVPCSLFLVPCSLCLALCRVRAKSPWWCARPLRSRHFASVADRAACFKSCFIVTSM